MNGLKLCYNIRFYYLFIFACFFFFCSLENSLFDVFQLSSVVRQSLVWCVCLCYCCRFNSLDSRFNRTILWVYFFLPSLLHLHTVDITISLWVCAHYKRNMVQSQIHNQINGQWNVWLYRSRHHYIVAAATKRTRDSSSLAVMLCFHWRWWMQDTIAIETDLLA